MRNSRLLLAREKPMPQESGIERPLCNDRHDQSGTKPAAWDGVDYCEVKLGGFRVPTQDMSGVLGSVRNDAMTAWAHGE
jgi:hypothetical protein